jgi:hypothetical protein
MRKIKFLDYTNIDTQMCLVGINEALAKLGVKEEDVISIQWVWNDNPVPISPSLGPDDKGWVTLFVYYWSDN